MNEVINAVTLSIGILFLIGFSWFGIVSIKEKERRAARIAFWAAILFSLPFFASTLLPAPVRIILIGFVILVMAAFVVLFLLPFGKIAAGNDEPQKRFDERDVPFSRERLIKDSPEYTAYYQMRPENLEIDTRTRTKPGFLSLDARFANPYLFAASQGSFSLTEAQRADVDGSVSRERYALSPEQMTAYLKALTRYFGALEVGITQLKPYQVYSHIGRGTGKYGDPIDIEHRFAIAFTTEMDFQMVGAAPKAPIAMESGKQYVEAARIAIQLAHALRYLGHPARAHIDGNYRVIAPLVARDAGLGEIGRMGLLMTPNQGPRVRLGVVTTDAELIPDQRENGEAVIDFCSICMKCAENCPSKSISCGEREEIEDALRWRINRDTCFYYWNVIGTDCGRCVAVCPYSHPDSMAHNFMRWGISRSGFFRRGAKWMDDLFYGEKPPPKPGPEWMQVS